MSRAGTVIVGGGLAAQRVAEALRRRGYGRAQSSTRHRASVFP